MNRRRKSGERGASKSDPRQETKMKHLIPEAIKYPDHTKEYPKIIETTISIGHIKDLIEDELRRNNWIKNDEDLVALSFGPIPWMNRDGKSKAMINSYLNLTMPLHYTLMKQEHVSQEARQQKKSEVKFRTYE